MAVYIDPAMKHPQSRIRCFREGASHLIADSIDELHRFAASIGMKREWFQDSKCPHYDLTLKRRKVAIAKGAVELGRRDFVLKMREVQGIRAGLETSGPRKVDDGVFS